MAKNKIQFQAGYSLFEFIQDYGTEEQRHQALYIWCYQVAVRSTVYSDSLTWQLYQYQCLLHVTISQ